jgi:hypothetical protein
MMKNNLLALLGAIAGGTVGYWAFFWIVEQEFYGLILPGGLLGLGAGIVKNRSWLIAVLCGLSAIGLGMYTEWRYAPFVKDESLAYFLAHILDLKPVTLLMIAVGGFLGFWVPFSRREHVATKVIVTRRGDK